MYFTISIRTGLIDTIGCTASRVSQCNSFTGPFPLTARLSIVGSSSITRTWHANNSILNIHTHCFSNFFNYNLDVQVTSTVKRNVKQNYISLPSLLELALSTLMAAGLLESANATVLLDLFLQLQDFPLLVVVVLYEHGVPTTVY